MHIILLWMEVNKKRYMIRKEIIIQWILKIYSIGKNFLLVLMLKDLK